MEDAGFTSMTVTFTNQKACSQLTGYMPAFLEAVSDVTVAEADPMLPVHTPLPAVRPLIVFAQGNELRDQAVVGIEPQNGEEKACSQEDQLRYHVHHVGLVEDWGFGKTECLYIPQA